MTDEERVEAGFADARRQLDEAVTQARENEARAKRLSADVETIRETVASANGEVHITARVGGRIEKVSFGPSAEELTPAQLGALVTQTIADAQHRAMQTLAERGAAEFGAESSIAMRMARDARTVFPPATAQK